jgi:SAM-dependent methyltransferase
MIANNIDLDTVKGFGQEWSRYDQSRLSSNEQRRIFEQYFGIFPWERLPADAQGFDLGCGSGRWAQLVAPRVALLHCIDASEAAIGVARKNLGGIPGCRFHLASVDQIPLADNSMDFGYSLGVLHHVPNTEEGIRSCVAKLKPGAPMLLYLYYAFDNRPWWFRLIWKSTDLCRRLICRLPMKLKAGVTTVIAACVYFPLARAAWLLEKLGFRVDGLPLSQYRNRTFYVMRTDALDRFGTRLEQRFSAHQIRAMMENAGLEDVTSSPGPPYWCMIGYKAAQKSLDHLNRS